MKFKILKAFAAFVFVAGFMMVLKSCKKVDTEFSKEELSTIQERVKRNVQKQIDELGGSPEIHIVNQRIPTRFVDMQDRTVNPHNPNLLARTTSACSFDLPDYMDLKQYMRIYQCAGSSLGGNGFKVQVEYQLSWNNNIALVNPYSTNNKTKLNIRVYSSANAVLYTVTTYDATITNLGVDPVNSNNNIFRVRFTSGVISSPYFIDMFTHAATTNTLRLSPYFATDCSSLESYVVTYQDPAAYGITPGAITSSCNRVEKAWYQTPGTVGAANVIGIAGLSPLGTSSCGYASPFVMPDLQEAWYSYDGGNTWAQFQNLYATGLGILNSRFIRWADFAKSAPIPSGSKNIVIAYKNWKYNTSQPTFPVPTSATACATYGSYTMPNSLTTVGITPDPTFVYEYYPNTIIP